MPKIDLKKDLKHLYSASAKNVETLDVHEMKYLMTDGSGDPNGPEFQAAVEALYSASYGIKFNAKKAGNDFTVMPLEGLFWMDDMSSFSAEDKDAWKWTLMILQPDFISKEMAQMAIDAAKEKKDLKLSPRFEAYHEGLSAQIMHIGPYSEEAPKIKMLHDFIRENGYALQGKHHEIYLSDPRRSAPEKMKTIIRQPMNKI